MTCKDCAARRKMARDALFAAKVGESASQVLTGAAEMVGLKPKTGEADLTASQSENKTRSLAGKSKEVTK